MIGRMRKFAFLLAVCLCLCPACGAEGKAYVMQLDDGALLIDGAGQQLTARGEYGILYGLEDDGQLFAGAPEDGDAVYALVGADGARLTDFQYQALERADSYVLCMKDERWGILDQAGRVLVEPSYTRLASAGDGVFLALKTDPYDDSPDGVYRVGADGSEKGTGVRIAGGLTGFSEGLCEAASADNGLYGYLDAEGRWAVQPSYEWAGSFLNGKASVVAAGGSGMIDRAGSWLLTPKYDYIYYQGGDMLTVAREDGVLSLLDPDTLEPVASYAGGGAYAYPAGGTTAVVMQSGRGAVVSRDGVEKLSFDECESIGSWNGMQDEVIVQLGEYGTKSVWLYGADGQALVGPYQDIIPLGSVNGQMYYTCVSYEATRVSYEEHGLSFWDEIPGTRVCSVIGPDGRLLAEYSADYISWMGDGLALVQSEDCAWAVTLEGEVIAEYVYDESDMAEVTDREEAIG